MTILSELAAESLVRAYLNGRTIPAVLRSAIVQAAEARLINGEMPVLNAAVRQDIDNQAIAPPGYIPVRAAPANRQIVYVLIKRDEVALQATRSLGFG